MFTEKSLRDYPWLIKVFMGLPAEAFWALVQKVEEKLPEAERQRLQRPDRHRDIGGGRDFDLPLVIRMALVLTYLRLHVPQVAIAARYGATQSDVSREVRRLLPAIQAGLPCPEVWRVVEEGQEIGEHERLDLEQLSAGRALVDATEQRVARPQDNDDRKAYYSGKKKAFTLKTEIVADGEHHVAAISTAVPGAAHDKKLSDQVQTVDRLPDGCEADADKGYQGLNSQVSLVTVVNPATGEEQLVPRLTVQTPFKKPKGGELTQEQKVFNRQLNSVRVRVEHCIAWAKNWAILATRFRCAHSIYTPILRTVFGLVNAQTQRWQAAKAAYCA